MRPAISSTRSSASADPEPASDPPPEREPDREIVAPRHGPSIASNRTSWSSWPRTRMRCSSFVPGSATSSRRARRSSEHGDGELDDGRVIQSLALGKEREHEDVAYGFRLAATSRRGRSVQRWEIPRLQHRRSTVYTTVCASSPRDRSRPAPQRRQYAAAGRLVLSWRGYVDLALEELRHETSISIQVLRRVQAMLEDLLGVAPLETATTARATSRTVRATHPGNIRPRRRARQHQSRMPCAGPRTPSSTPTTNCPQGARAKIVACDLTLAQPAPPRRHRARASGRTMHGEARPTLARIRR